MRELGALVLAVGGATCAVLALPKAGPHRTFALVAGAFVLFVVSHRLGDAIGAWPAVLLSSAVLAALAAALTRRRA